LGGFTQKGIKRAPRIREGLKDVVSDFQSDMETNGGIRGGWRTLMQTGELKTG